MSALDWVYVLDEDMVYNIRPHLPAGWQEGYAFLDRQGRCRLELHPNGDLRIPAGYAWDGCTPKYALFDILLGIPDGAPSHRTQKPKTYYASLVHDVLYQFLELNPAVPRRVADRIFLELMARDGFAPRRLYYAAVVLFGGLSRRLARRKRGHAGQRRPLLP